MTKKSAASQIPLVVDLDGTLLKVDSLHEAFVEFLSKKPIHAVRALASLKQGRAAFKEAIADHVLPQAETLPVDEAVLDVMKRAREDGRKVYLATAADRRFAEAIADEIGAFDGVIASENGINLKGEVKAESLVARFGAHRFDYVGNDAADLPVWRAARSQLVAGASPHFAERVRSELPEAIVLGTRKPELGAYLRALRPHQWLKNGLVALPALAAHSFSVDGIITVLIAIASFSLGASSIYLVNDMLDLPHDRAHPAKRHRALAAGAVPLVHGIALFAVTAALSIALALLLPVAFIAILIVYMALSLSYSVYLKRKLMIDVVALAALYGIRVLAGGAAAGIALSHWLVGFCFFIFLSLALVKRTTEMMTLPQRSVGKIKGRGYRRMDLQTITALTAASGFVAVLVLALYINSPDVTTLYHRPELLWGVCLVLVYWLGRVCFITGRGEMHQDPVIFAVTDRISLIAGALVVAIFLAAL